MMKISKALHVDVESVDNEMVLGEEDVGIQIDESCLFSRKYDVGRVLRITDLG